MSARAACTCNIVRLNQSGFNARHRRARPGYFIFTFAFPAARTAARRARTGFVSAVASFLQMRSQKPILIQSESDKRAFYGLFEPSITKIGQLLNYIGV